ncbi:mixed lineage kinase domain-like protein [Halichoeres trimaculatus]|uniref:mixed lineage kinase domain-like protein n=1 Tax=Halichoeres trimaculatus TaxID=147232 RepID=UPI003D9EA7EA
MEVIEPILSLTKEIYDLVEKVKANKKRCRRVSERVQALEELVASIKQRDERNISQDVDNPLRELCITLTSAKELIKQYTMTSWIDRILKSGSQEEEFDSVNERLSDAFKVLSVALQVEQGNILFKVFELTSRKKEDEVDGKEDNKEMMKSLNEYMQSQEEKMNKMLKDFEEVKTNVVKAVEMLNKANATEAEAIRVIKPEEIDYGYPKEPFLTTDSSEMYKGKYNGFDVAIKRYKDPVSATPREIRSFFKKEVETMKRFESPNILRLFGICVQDEEGPQPQYLIVTEYCVKGNLRAVLDSGCNLPWDRKARMCLDAAKGLYRLHQTEAKSKVHGCITSSKFLVAEGYIVKLGGFELAKTETSLKKGLKSKERQSACYLSPQMLGNINHVYSKQCEMYSFGIVLWEIATRKKPFEGLSSKEIYQKVCKEKFMEELPDDCPEELGSLIIACRAFDGFQRPSAGVLVDKLRPLVARLED